MNKGSLRQRTEDPERLLSYLPAPTDMRLPSMYGDTWVILAISATRSSAAAPFWLVNTTDVPLRRNARSTRQPVPPADNRNARHQVEPEFKLNAIVPLSRPFDRRRHGILVNVESHDRMREVAIEEHLVQVDARQRRDNISENRYDCLRVFQRIDPAGHGVPFR